MPSKERFTVSHEGMREQHAGRAPWELVQNAWDEAHNTIRANRSAEQALRIRRPRGDPVPLAFPAIVPQEGWEEVQRLRTRSRERPRRSPSRRTVSQRRPPSPQCPGSWLRSDGASAQSPDPPQGPAKPPVQADRGARRDGRGPSGRSTGASITGETASGVRSNALPPRSLNSKTELRP